MKKIEEVTLPNGRIRRRVYTENKLPSKTDTQYLQDTDVNYILSRYQKTGQLQHVRNIQGQYADVSSIPDLHTALHNVKLAKDSFMQLPSQIRKLFDNDPSKMIEFLRDPSNDQMAIELGLKAAPELPDEPIMDGPAVPAVDKPKGASGGNNENGSNP